MRQYLKKTVALILFFAFLVGGISVSANAASERSSLYLSLYRAWLTPKNNGAISVNIDVQAVGIMDDIGATEVAIYESSDGGTTWTQDGIYLSSLYPDLLQQDTYLYCETPITHIGRPGNKYYAVITIYAGDSTGYDTREYQTTTITAKWKGD